MSEANATITFTLKGALNGRDPVTRQPIFDDFTESVRVFVRQDRRPATQIFPGADETQEILKGAFVSPPQIQQDIAANAVCVIALDQGVTAAGQIKILADQWGAQQSVYGRNIKGDRFYLLLERKG